ncbi:heavy metal translocating P-type ATPase metal-binding domain-containing protein [uncultured Tistrella sp.]|uniref:heavy metal translocating P-type ATPase n=1 Tax=Tistrella mobilis TaxID=171437 RepID=UPI002632AF5F|nr:heavy metal translocating P-type ATPase metal-binding domain-containing protein [uncultured Tistrella sp.]
MSIPLTGAGREDAAAVACAHCGQPVIGRGTADAAGQRYCCTGCAAAADLVRELGLDGLYARRTLDPTARPPRPDEELPELVSHVRTDDRGRNTIDLMVDGLQCAACVQLIERAIAADDRVADARMNMTTRRLRVAWDGAPELADRLVNPAVRLGYRLLPYDAERMAAADDAQGRELIRAMAVAGFAAGNVMLLSIGIWAAGDAGMGEATRSLLHWASALIALPAIAYAGRPFFKSAWSAVSRGRTNMDVPISIGVILTAAASLAHTWRGELHAYFDSATMLLFFLLIGRVLDARARGQARRTVAELIALARQPVSILDEATGALRRLAASDVRPGMIARAAAGERIGVDGVVLRGQGEIDQSLVTGESLPRMVVPGDRVTGGAVVLGAPLDIRVDAAGEDGQLAEMARLIEAAEQRRAGRVAFADRVSRAYAPTVHLAALLTFFGWWALVGINWYDALSHAVAVLIITCPCALALAVPATQVAAASALARRGVLLQSPLALERLGQVDHVVLDKTGTLTLGRPRPVGLEPLLADADARLRLGRAAALAAMSRHPLSQALAQAVPADLLPVAPAGEGGETAVEQAGHGMALGAVRLGKAAFCGLGDETAAAIRAATPPAGDDISGPELWPGPELWYVEPGARPLLIRFADPLRPAAAETVAALKARGMGVELVSGDRPEAVAAIARAVGIDGWTAEALPADKARRIRDLTGEGRRVLMVGDGLNDAPALAEAAASIAPAGGADLAQGAADAVFRGERLDAVITTLAMARAAERTARQNVAAAIVYNMIAVPAAVAGFVTPLIAALAMSGSSLIVILNAVRLGRGVRS